MKPSLLFVITSDPRSSHRPAEAIRIAAGVGVWQKVEVTLYLHGAAVLALGESTDELVDEDNYRRYLPMLSDFGRPIFVERGSICLQQMGPASLPFEEISAKQLADLASRTSSVVHF